jgi:hypothetical protein
MKTIPVLLVLSLAANATLLLINPPGLTPKLDRPKAGAIASGNAKTVPAGGVESLSAAGKPGAIAAALKGDDAEALRDELRAAGVGEEVIRAVVGASIWQRYAHRFEELQPAPDAKSVWWKNDENGYWGGQSKEQRVALKALQAELKAEGERVLGKDSDASKMNPWMERQYGFASAEKREAIQQLEQDYNELQSDLRRETRGFQTPADAEKTRFIEEEKRRDLAALLTPTELAEYDRRNSRTAQNLRWRMTAMDASEEEYLAVFELRKDFDERFADSDPYGNRLSQNKSEDDGKARREAEKALNAQLRQTLGPERYQAYVYSNDGDYQQLQAATKRFGLAAGTPRSVLSLREETAKAATRLADDVGLTGEQKRAEMGKLVEQARGKIAGLLGGEVAQTYFDNNGASWLGQLQRGTIVTYDENGAQSHRRVEFAPSRPANTAK